MTVAAGQGWRASGQDSSDIDARRLMPFSGAALDQAEAALRRHATVLTQQDDDATAPNDGVPPSSRPQPGAALDPFGCFTRVLAAVQSRLSDQPAGPLAGITFAVKDLFDVAGLSTTAGAGFRVDAPPAHADAEVVRRLKAAGASLVATCNMDEFAYGFSTVNATFGTTLNPHDPGRLAGGSSGGSAAAVAAGLVPLALGSDTNGSIRVPASLCGVYGLRPTHGTLSMDGVFPFVDALDVPGPLASSLALLRSAYEVMDGQRLPDGDAGSLRVARLDGWFHANAGNEANEALDRARALLGVSREIAWPEAARARSAAYVLSAAEGGARHLADLHTRPEAFDPAVRDRLIAGARMPAPMLVAAQCFAAWYAGAMARFWDDVDIVVTPATPVTAPRLDETMIEIGGERVPTRANLGILTQPISLAGCPVLAVPLNRPGRLPLGLQLVAAPGREDRLFAYARRLDDQGVTGFTPAPAT